jgi:hypothetical protein
MLKVNS